MPSFTDTSGREWHLTVTGGTIKRVKQRTDFMLASIFDDELKVLAHLCADICLLVDVLWAVCQPQAGDLTGEEFAEHLGGDSLNDAKEALVRATADFFPSPARQSFHEMLDKLDATAKQAMAMAAATMTQEIKKIDPEQLAKNYIDFVSSGQASAELIRTREPPVNSL